MHYIILICSLVFIMRALIRLQEKNNFASKIYHHKYSATNQLIFIENFLDSITHLSYTIINVFSLSNQSIIMNISKKKLCCRFNPFNKSAMSSFNFFIDVIFYCSQFQTFVIAVNYHRIFLKYKFFVKTRDLTTLLSRNIQNVLSLKNNHYHPLEKLAAENYILLFDFTQITIVEAEWHISLEHFFSVLPF